jgi:hypothetical protein
MQLFYTARAADAWSDVAKMRDREPHVPSLRYNDDMSVETDEIPKTYSQAARLMTKWQGESGPPDVKIFWLPDPRKRSVRLIAVSDDFIASGSAWASSMGPSADFPFRSGLILLTPHEWRAVLRHKMSLPKGWDLASRRQVWP